MKTIFLTGSLLISCVFIHPIFGCDNHQYKSNLHTWHTRTYEPLLDKIASGKITSKEAFAAALKTVTEQGPHVNEAYQAIGLDSAQHVDILALYAKKKGKSFTLHPIVVKYLDELKRLRNQNEFTAQSAEDFATLRIKMMDTETDPDLRSALSMIIVLFEESGTFWDIALNEYALGPKSRQSVRRDTWDATNYSNYFFALRELGLDYDAAHTIAIIETAYDGILCKDCGVW